MTTLTGKTAFVTAAAQGIGRATALASDAVTPATVDARVSLASFNIGTAQHLAEGRPLLERVMAGTHATLPCVADETVPEEVALRAIESQAAGKHLIRVVVRSGGQRR